MKTVSKERTVSPKSGRTAAPDTERPGARTRAQSIAIEATAKVYRGRGAADVQALLPTTLKIEAGEFVSLVGPSGCGKTTLLKLIAGLLEPTEGRIFVADRAVEKPDPSVSFVFQKPTLLNWYTVEENILLPSKVGSGITPAVRKRVQHLLEITGLKDFARRYPAELSGGMQQRASIARALAGNPDVLLMDEPFSALDEFTREKLNDELLSLWSEQPKTVVFVTHNIAEAVYLSDRVAVMEPRPGRVRQVIDVNLARPRRADLRQDQAFFEYVTATRECFDETRTDK